MRCSGTVSLSLQHGYSASLGQVCTLLLLVTCMQSGHVDSTYIVTNLLLEEHKSRKQHVSSGEFCDSVKHINGVTTFLLEVDKPLRNIVVSLWCFVTASKQGFMTLHTV